MWLLGLKYWGVTVCVIYAQAGNKKALRESASYPRNFGLAVSALAKRGGEFLGNVPVSLTAYSGVDPLRSLDDLIRGRGKSWWRTLLP